MGWFERMVSIDGKLRGKDRNDRFLIFLVAVLVFPIAAALLPLLPSDLTEWVLFTVSNMLALVSSSAVLLLCVSGVHLTRPMIMTWIVFLAGSVIIADFNMRTIGSAPVWPVFVLLADLSLVIGLGRRFATGLVAAAGLWVVVTCIEHVTRYGLFDIPGSASQEERWSRKHVCTTLPCAVPTATGLYELAMSMLVLVVDFAATRSFADTAEKEQAAMAHTIKTVEAIAKLLAGYDVDTVAEMLQEAEAEGRLPVAMHEALQRLEQNLRAYRPYLPEALFEQLHRDEDKSRIVAVDVPGTISEMATIVFTDVRASTSIWEAAPEAMKKAMQTHNMVIREAIRRLGGYEVKTIGDAFMVAFEEARIAVDFGLAVQQQLLDAQWPAALLELPICRRTDLWGGLTVRIGVNHGPVTLETNVLTGRVDYFGHTVNVAARLEGVCLPGAVAVPADLWAQVQHNCSSCVVSGVSPVNLDGVAEAVPVRHVWPPGVSGRRHHPLQANMSEEFASIASSLSEPVSSSRSLRARELRSMFVRERHATIGCASLCAPCVNLATASTISESLEAVMPLLQQSRGTLITLLGEHVFVGWNLVHAVPVHAENAVSFAQRVLRSPCGEDMTLGLASGMVHHGDVGTSTQRFVTAAGRTVEACLQVWRAAHVAAVQCLYASTDSDRLVGALQSVLHATTVHVPSVCGVYELPLDEVKSSSLRSAGILW